MKTKCQTKVQQQKETIEHVWKSERKNAKHKCEKCVIIYEHLGFSVEFHETHRSIYGDLCDVVKIDPHIYVKCQSLTTMGNWGQSIERFLFTLGRIVNSNSSQGVLASLNEFHRILGR